MAGERSQQYHRFRRSRKPGQRIYQQLEYWAGYQNPAEDRTGSVEKRWGSVRAEPAGSTEWKGCILSCSYYNFQIDSKVERKHWWGTV